MPKTVRRAGRAVSHLFGALALASSGIAFTASSAQAAACDVQIGYTYRSGNQIWGFGSLSDCPANATAKISIQWERGWEWWDYLSTRTVNGPGYDQYVSFNCAGTGTHNFRTIIERDSAAPGVRIKTSRVIRQSC